MKIKIAKNSIFIMSIILIIGFIIIFSSYSIGEKIGDNAIQKNGGMMDTGEYERIIETSASNIRTVGMIVSLISGFGLLLSGFAFYNEL